MSNMSGITLPCAGALIHAATEIRVFRSCPVTAGVIGQRCARAFCSVRLVALEGFGIALLLFARSLATSFGYAEFALKLPCSSGATVFGGALLRVKVGLRTNIR